MASALVIQLGLLLPAVVPAADAAAAAATSAVCMRVVVGYMSLAVLAVVAVIMGVTHVLRRAMTSTIAKAEARQQRTRKKSSGSSTAHRELKNARRTVNFLFWAAAGIGLPFAVPFLALLASVPLAFDNSWLFFHVVAHGAVFWQTIVMFFWAK